MEVERELNDSDYLYLQENFTVTDSIFVDENIIFSNVTAAWIDFCLNVLGVQFPAPEVVRPIENSRVRQDQDHEMKKLTDVRSNNPPDQ